MPGAHEDAHQLGDLLVAHVLLEVGRRYGRIAEPAGDSDGAVRVGRVLEKGDAELGVHRSVPSGLVASALAGGFGGLAFRARPS